MTDYKTMLTLLQELATGTPKQDGCAGCDYEHNCQTEGCAILREAIATMQQMHKDLNACGCMTCTHRHTSLRAESCRSCHKGYGVLKNWKWRGVQSP